MRVSRAESGQTKQRLQCRSLRSLMTTGQFSSGPKPFALSIPSQRDGQCAPVRSPSPFDISVPGELFPQFTAAMKSADNSESRIMGASRVGGTRFCLQAGNAWEYLLPYYHNTHLIMDFERSKNINPCCWRLSLLVASRNLWSKHQKRVTR